jgi:hypothetical protein
VFPPLGGVLIDFAQVHDRRRDLEIKLYLERQACEPRSPECGMQRVLNELGRLE